MLRGEARNQVEDKTGRYTAVKYTEAERPSNSRNVTSEKGSRSLVVQRSNA